MIEKNSLVYDMKKWGIIFLVIILLLIIIVLFQSITIKSDFKRISCNLTNSSLYSNVNNLSKSDLSNTYSLLTTIYVSLLGFFITATTILFMFDSEKNEILKKIKKANLYYQIFERFISTIIITFIALILSVIFYFISLYIFSLILIIITIYFIGLVFLRTYRVLNILNLIYSTLSKKK